MKAIMLADDLQKGKDTEYNQPREEAQREDLRKYGT